MRPCYILISLATISQNLAAITYSLTSRVDRKWIDDISANFSTSSIRFLECATHCMNNAECQSTFFDEQTKQCRLHYSANLNITEGIIDTGVTHAQKIDCDWLTKTTEDCCYPAGCLFCITGNIYKDCQEAFEQGEINSGGLYFLRPVSTWRIVRAVCVFDSTSGWTVIQRRMDASVDFYRNWTSYVDGFGNLKDNYWIGLESIYYLTRENRKLSIYLEAHDGETRTANYSSFYIDDADTNYVNNASGYSGNAGDSWDNGGHNGRKFSTYDKDNDLSSSNCALKYQAAWWYNSCHSINLNGRWYAGGTTSSFATGTSWKTWKGHHYSYKTIYVRLGR